MIYFRTPETVYLLQTSYTNHNYPFYSPTNADLSLSHIHHYSICLELYQVSISM